jgi:hypothetical protein
MLVSEAREVHLGFWSPVVPVRRQRTMSAEPEDERNEMFSYYEAQADSYEDFYEGRGQAVA